MIGTSRAHHSVVINAMATNKDKTMTAEETFRDGAPGGMDALMRRFNLADFQAAGPVGNFGHESTGFTALREVGAAPGRGGYGFGQWTGPRHILFLNWCAANHLDWRTPSANWGYLVHELSGADPRNSYAYVIVHLREAKTLEEATRAFMNYYERPGVPEFSDRLRWAELALKLHQSAATAKAA
jgi:hypothetical protein